MGDLAQSSLFVLRARAGACAPMPRSGKPSFARERPRRSGAERREQDARADARAIQRTLKGFSSLQEHRGCRPTKLGEAFAQALRTHSANASAGTGETQESEQAPPTAIATSDS